MRLSSLDGGCLKCPAAMLGQRPLCCVLVCLSVFLMALRCLLYSSVCSLSSTTLCRFSSVEGCSLVWPKQSTAVSSCYQCCCSLLTVGDQPAQPARGCCRSRLWQQISLIKCSQCRCAAAEAPLRPHSQLAAEAALHFTYIESSFCSAHAGRFPRPQPGVVFPRSNAVDAAARQQELLRLFYVGPARPVLLVAETIHSPCQAGLGILAVPHCIMHPHK